MIATTHRVLATAAVLPKAIRGISISTTMTNIIPMDGQGGLLRPCIYWMDGRAGEEAQLVMRKLGGPRHFNLIVGSKAHEGPSGHFDAAGRKVARSPGTLVRQYLLNPRMSRAVESQLWHAVYGLYWESARGYHTFVRRLAREKDSNPHDGPIPLITLRAIRTLGQLLKWRAIRYLPATDKLWLRLHNLYRIAETEGFHRKPQRIYAEDTSECNCETAYLHILMMDLAYSGSLYPRQIDLLDRWLCGWHDMLQLDARYEATLHNFVIDLSADRRAPRAQARSRQAAAFLGNVRASADNEENTSRLA